MYKNLFVPVDGGAQSQRAMQASIDLARQLGAAITGFVVEPDVPMPTMGGTIKAYEAASTRHIERTDAHARAILTHFEQMAVEAGVRFTGLHARTDGVDRAIIDQAENSGCDMIVMLTHGRGTFGELLFGSHTKQVLAQTSLPLLVLH
jgi:nucleotide-binding universal stress UspA family protein